jgi:hypothetical protein
MKLSRVVQAVPLVASVAALVWGCSTDDGTGGSNNAGSGDAAALDGSTVKGDGAPGDGGKSDAAASCVTTITGSTYDPAGKTALYNVMVYVPTRDLAPLTTGPSCDEHCGALPAGLAESATLSNAKGEFTLTTRSVAADATEATVVYQVGKWRRQVTIPGIEPCRKNILTDHDLMRLPKSQAEGNVPRMALVTGPIETPECLLRKFGVTDSEFTGSGGTGRVHIYKGSSGGSAPGGSLAAKTLYESKTTLFNYDTVYLGCEAQEPYADNGTSSGIEAVARNAVYDYANAGGRILASHFNYYWFKYGPQAPNGSFPTTASWASTAGSTSTFNVDTSFPKGQAFAEWLFAQNAAPAGGAIILNQANYDVGAAGPASTAWIKNPTGTSAKALSFNAPVGTPEAQQCGRVTFADFHIGSTDSGGSTFPTGCKSLELTPQEKALEFLFFDLACVMDDTKAPPTPQ